MAKIKPKLKKTDIDAENPITLWTTAKDYLEQNARQIGAIAIAVIVVAGAFTAWTMMRAKAEQESLTMFYGAMTIKSLAIDSKTGAVKPDMYEKALQQFKDVRQKHGGTQAGTLALLYAGNCAYSLKKYDEAIGYYKEFLESSHGSLDYLRTACYEGLGYANEGKGDYKQAAEYYEKQKKESDGSGAAILNMARALELSGDKQKACQQYKEFIEKNPMASQKQFAQIKADSMCPKKG